MAQLLSGVGRRGAVVTALVLVLSALLLVPLPRPLLDILIVCNFLVALVLVLLSLLSVGGQRLFAFPAILLLATLYRLALNVSSTRLILLNGDQGLDAAGSIIESFGAFVVQRDVIVGGIIFAIIAVVNFVVIAKGAARVAEVSARFSLDALPGKQLAIDADLRSGNINKQEAHELRGALAKESQFFGSMDGAMKFVQGDAIAGFLITFINLVGGIGIGLSREMEFSSALGTFGVLTIGDGLVGLIPSLIVSVCAGIVVTRVERGDNTSSSDDIFNEITSEPRALVIASVVLFAVGVLPGIPFLPFFVVAAALLFWLFRSSALQPDFPVENPGVALLGEARPFEIGMSPVSSESLRALSLEFDPAGLGQYFDRDSQAVYRSCLEYAEATRRNIFRKRGVLLPALNLQVNPDFSLGSYGVLVREHLERSGSVDGNQVFVAANGSMLRGLGVRVEGETHHPIDRRAASWVARGERGLAALRRLEIDVFEVYEFLVLEAYGAALEVVEEVFGLDEVKSRLLELKEEHAGLYDEIFQTSIVSYAEFADVLRRLVREQVNVRDLKLILEGIAEYSSRESESEDRQRWLAGLHSFLRKVLSRGIVNDVLSPSGKLRTFGLSEQIEEEFRAASSVWDGSRSLPPIEPQIGESLRRSAEMLFNPVLDRGALPVVVLCSGDIRPAVESFFSSQMRGGGWFRTLAFEELDGQQQLESVGVLELSG